MEEYISHFQLLPPRNEVREPITYYIDATMRQWFEDYGWRIGRRVRADALAREREAYLSSRYVVAMSDWCSEDVVSSYGVPREKVRTILPGANLDEESLPPAEEWDGSCRRCGWASSGSTGSERAGRFFSMLPRSCNAWDTMSKSWSWGPTRAASLPIRP